MFRKMKKMSMVALFALFSCAMAADNSVQQEGVPAAGAAQVESNLTEGERLIIRDFGHLVRSQLTDYIPGSKMLLAASDRMFLPIGYETYTESLLVSYFTAQNLGNGGIARFIGDRVRQTVSVVPGGNYVTAFADRFRRADSNSLTEDMINYFGGWYLERVRAAQNPA